MTRCTDAWTWRRGSQGSLTVGRAWSLRAYAGGLHCRLAATQQRRPAAFISLAVDRRHCPRCSVPASFTCCWPAPLPSLQCAR